MIEPSDSNLRDKQYLHNWFKDFSFYLSKNSVPDKSTLSNPDLASSLVDEFGGIQSFEQFVNWQQSQQYIIQDGLLFASELVESHINCIEQQSLPQNFIFLRPYIDAVARKETVNSCKYHLIEEPSDIPFPELILPISSTIFHEWQIALSPRAGTLFDAMAQQDVYHWISNRLATLLTPSFYDDFNSKRTQETLIQSYKDKKELGHSPTTLYRNYIEEIQFDLEKFLRRNSGLVNILCKAIQYGKRAVTLLSERVSAHHQAIQKTFLQDSTPFKVTRILIGEGDTHDQGLSVAIITVNSGSKETKIVYKPRSIDLDHQFYKLCKILESRYSASPTEIYPKTLPLENFGFIEYVDNCPCKNKQELGLFYHNFGRLLCLSRMLSGTDIHFENLIASGRNAVLIDCETLFTPTFKTILHPFDDFPEENMSVQLIRSSVMATLMLPKWIYIGAEKIRIDMSAIGVNGGRDEDKPYVKSWFERNTDLMMPSMVESNQTTIRSLPVEAFITNPAPDFAEDICNGFIDLYKNLHEDQSYWLGDSSPLHLFKGQKQRVVFRATDFYARILSNSIQPQNLLSETHRQVSLYKLSRVFTQCKHKPDGIKIFEEEIVQLTRGDIPAFYSRTNSDGLFTNTSHDVDHSLIQKSGLETVYLLFQSMCDQDLALQLTLIKGSLDARFSTTGQTIQCKQGLCQDSNSIENSFSLSIDNKSKRALLAFEYSKTLLLQHKEDVCWIGHQIYFGKRGISFFLLNDDLLQGRIGICCALSSFQSNHDQPEFGELRSIVSRCAEKVYIPFTTNSEFDFEKTIDISPGLNGITGHLIGSKILMDWCHKTNNQQLKEILEQSTKAIIDHCSNHGTFLDVDCNGSLYTSAYALFNYLPYLEEYFKPDQLSNFFQAWIHQLQDLKPDALLLHHGLHEGTLGMIRAALKNSERLNVPQYDHLKNLFHTAAHKLFVDLSSSTPLSISDGIGGTLISIAEAYQQGWMDKATSVAMIENGLHHLNQQLLRNNVQLSHDLAFGYAGLDWMLKHLNNIIEPSICQKIRLDLEFHCQRQLGNVESISGFKTITKSMRYQAIGPFTGVLGIENYLDQGFESQLFVDVLMAL